MCAVYWWGAAGFTLESAGFLASASGLISTERNAKVCILHGINKSTAYRRELSTQAEFSCREDAHEKMFE
jgi:hypothetical protein